MLPRRGRPGLRTPTSRPSGAYPRAGGEHCEPSLAMTTRAGSSPRGRGTRFGGRRHAGHCRFIPARAGNTAYRHGMRAPSSVHPRAGGEHSSERTVVLVVGGSSPRGRGTRAMNGQDSNCGRFIPARAGNTPLQSETRLLGSVHPRAGGEHRLIHDAAFSPVGSSPRGRGTLADRHLRATPRRFIPARAGNTP